MLHILWTIASIFIGLYMGIVWVAAYNDCKENKKWLMITPAWIFMASIYKTEGSNIRLRALLCTICIVFMGWLFWVGLPYKS